MRLLDKIKQKNRFFRSISLILFILICVFVILISDLIEKRYALEVDFSYNEITTQSEVTKDLLAQLNKDVHFYLISSTGSANQTVRALMVRYASMSPHITWSEENVAQNPVLLTQFNGILGSQTLSSDCILVYCAENNRARMLEDADFVVYSFDSESGNYAATGLNYEKALTEAVLYTAQSDPETVQVLQGHNELNGEDFSLLEKRLENANYAVEYVNLLQGGTLNSRHLLIIPSPQFDLSQREIALLNAFAEEGGNFLIFVDYDDPLDLSNLNALLNLYGISFFSGLVMAKENALDAYYNGMQAYLMPHMNDCDLTSPLLQQEKSILLMPGSRALAYSDVSEANLSIEPLLWSGESYIRNYLFAAPDEAAQQESDLEGYFPLAVLSSHLTDSGKISKAEVIGNCLMFTSEWVDENTYSADFLLRSIEYLQGESPFSLQIDAKAGIREPLRITNFTIPILLLCIIPLLILVCAAAVLLPRKNR